MRPIRDTVSPAASSARATGSACSGETIAAMPTPPMASQPTKQPGAMTEGDEVAACDVGPSDFKSRVALFERELLSRALAENRFNQRATADSLGLTYDQLRHALRRHDLIGRLGGEEFAVFLPDTALGQAMQLAERLRKQVAITAMAAPGEPEPIRITISIGLAMLSGQESLESLLARADDALYQAKREGRNRVVQASAPTHAG